MRVMQCLDCGMEARPKSYHPSSLRVEGSLWGVAILVGIVAGVFSAAEPTGLAQGPAVPALAAVAAPDVAVDGPRAHLQAQPPSNTTVLVSNWIRERVAMFLRSAWWVLPIPVLFSLWRQASKRHGCPKCGSRKLIPVLDMDG